jgi:Uma2 family endonuclease
MTTLLPKATEPFYPSSDGEPLAETSVHVDAIINAVVALRLYLGDSAIVLADQFLYYAKGFPKLRIAPDIMVVLGAEPGPRDNYKTWEEGRAPSVIFEITSPSTETRDKTTKKDLYEHLEVLEYWLFDPKGEWIAEKLRGYRLQDDIYQPIADGISTVLSLRLQVEAGLIGFYRLDTGEKLPIPLDLLASLQAERERADAERERADAERERADAERERADAERSRADRLTAYLRSLGVDPNDLPQ